MSQPTGSLHPSPRLKMEGIELPADGTLSVIINRWLVESDWSSPAMQRLRAILPDMTKKDNRIIACAQFVQDSFPPPPILVTKDVNAATFPAACCGVTQMRLGRRPASPAPAGLAGARALCWPAESGLAPGSSAGGRAAFNVALKARAVGLEAQDYLNDKVPPPDEDEG